MHLYLPETSAVNLSLAKPQAVFTPCALTLTLAEVFSVTALDVPLSSPSDDLLTSIDYREEGVRNLKQQLGSKRQGSLGEMQYLTYSGLAWGGLECPD